MPKLVLWGLRKRLIYTGLVLAVLALGLVNHYVNGGEISDYLATILIGIILGAILYSYLVKRWLKERLKDDGDHGDIIRKLSRKQDQQR